VFSGDTPPEDNLFALTATLDELAIASRAAYDDSVAAAIATADSIRASRPRMTTVSRPLPRSTRTAREVVVVSATASQVLGPAAVGMPRLDAFYAPGFPADDPRIGKSGTLDPTRQKAAIPIRVVIPVPNETHRASPSEKR
jgi:hypothetical protein